ncbi:keratin-associated protein 13-1-like [Phyllostomus hastatus]|uniref:keratin-associated protein 13-1-like n=1 Tax=Phyllostomus hastatus TaxID=9423 RepID=UPI001E68380E|nr:keratin-associated protein 13-1-like [Phyllostomus hastatus]
MSTSCRSGNSSSRSLGSSQRCPSSSCGSSCGSSCSSSNPGTPAPSRDPCPCLQGPSPQSSYQVICWAPSSCRPSCCSPRVPVPSSPCQVPSTGAQGQGSSSSCSQGSGSGGLRPQGCGACGVPSPDPGSGSRRPTCGTPRSCQSSGGRPSCGSSAC